MGCKIQAVQSEDYPPGKMDRYFGVHNKQAMVASSIFLWRTAVVVIINNKYVLFFVSVWGKFQASKWFSFVVDGDDVSEFIY